MSKKKAGQFSDRVAYLGCFDREYLIIERESRILCEGDNPESYLRVLKKVIKMSDDEKEKIF